MQISLTPVAARRPFVPARAPVACRRPRCLTVRAGLFDGLFGGGAGPAKGQAAEIVEELLTATQSAGPNPRPAVREEIEELAGQLRRFRPRAPTRSPLFWGEYDVAYTANPNATGGPVLTSGLGRFFAAGQQPRQTLLQDEGLLVNTVEFRTLGVLPGKVRQEGQLTVLDGNRYEVQLERGRGEPITRRFEVLYLDERVRIVQFLPEEDDREPSLFIFSRVTEEQQEQEEEEEEADEDADAAPPKPTWLPLGGTRRVKTAVAQPAAEAADESEDAEPEQPRPLWGLGGGTRRLRAKQEPAAAEGNGADGQLEQLVQAAKESTEARKATAQQLRELEKEAVGTAKSAAPARAAFERAQREAEDLEAQLAAAVQAAQAANERYQQAASELREAERAAR